MAPIVFERTLGAYRLSVDRDANTRLEHSSIPHRGRITWLPPSIRVNLDGTEVDEPFQWGVYDAREDGLDLVAMECELAGLRVRITLGFHPFHRVPLRVISVRNVTGRPLADVEVEVGFPMPPDSGFVVLSSSDRIAMTHREKGGTALTYVTTEPVPIPFRPSLADGTRTAQVNSILLPAGQAALPGTRSGTWQELVDEHYPGAAPDKVLVDGSPAYLFKVPTLAPNHTLCVAAPYFLLRTTRDTARMSGIGFAVHRDDWAGALACVNAPTYLGYSGGVVDQLLGLYSPIEFYDSPTVPDVTACLQRLQRETGVSTIYLILPDSFEKGGTDAFHDAIEHAVGDANVCTLGPVPRSLLPIHLHTAVSELLASAALLSPTPPRQLVVSSTALECDSLADASIPDSLLSLSNDPLEIAWLIRRFRPATVVLPRQGGEQLRDNIQTLATKLGADLDGVTFWYADRTPSTSSLSGDAARQAAARCVANAVVSVFQVNDIGLLDQLFTQVVESWRLSAPEMVGEAERMRARRDVNMLLRMSATHPDLAVRSVAYSMCGPCALVVGVLTRHRWHDAVIAAQFARAKKLPVMFVTIDDDAITVAEEQVRGIERQFDGSGHRPADAVAHIGWEWLSPENRFHLLRLARKSLILFDGGLEVPWELASWSHRGVERLQDRALLAHQFDIGRMTAPQVRQVGRIVHRTLRESLAPPTSHNRVLLVWDGDIDSFMGEQLENQAISLLAIGLEVDVLAPPARLNRLHERAPAGSALRGDQCTRPLALTQLADGEYSVIVVVLHGVRQVDGEVSLAIDDEFISGADLPELRSHPIVVLNSCWAGRTTTDDTRAIVGGLAVQFVGQGAFQIIAPQFPVSARGAILVTDLVLRYGWMRSAARMLRRSRQVAMSVPAADQLELDTLWYTAYGDPTASKMFELDGVWEVEDAVEKIAATMPNLDPFRDDPASARHVIDVSRELVRQGTDIAWMWARRAIGQLERYATSVGLPVLTKVLCAQMKRALEIIDVMGRTAESNHAALQALIDSGRLKSDYGGGETQTD